MQQETNCQETYEVFVLEFYSLICLCMKDITDDYFVITLVTESKQWVNDKIKIIYVEKNE